MTTVTTINCATPKTEEGESIASMAAKLDKPQSAVMAEAKAAEKPADDAKAKAAIEKIKQSANKTRGEIPEFLAQPAPSKEEAAKITAKHSATTINKSIVMSKGKKPHPADTQDNALIPTAAKFITSLFVNGGYSKLDAKTLNEARDNIEKLRKSHPKATRKPLVYAVLPDGREILVAAKYDPAPASVATSKSAKVAVTKAKGRSKWTDAEENAKNGVIPTPPDFSANTHKYYRKALAEVVAMVAAKNIDGLKRWKPARADGSPGMIDRYRRIAITALQAKPKK